MQGAIGGAGTAAISQQLTSALRHRQTDDQEEDEEDDDDDDDDARVLQQQQQQQQQLQRPWQPHATGGSPAPASPAPSGWLTWDVDTRITKTAINLGVKVPRAMLEAWWPGSVFVLPVRLTVRLAVDGRPYGDATAVNLRADRRWSMGRQLKQFLGARITRYARPAADPTSLDVHLTTAGELRQLVVGRPWHHMPIQSEGEDQQQQGDDEAGEDQKPQQQPLQQQSHPQQQQQQQQQQDQGEPPLAKTEGPDDSGQLANSEPQQQHQQRHGPFGADAAAFLLAAVNAANLVAFTDAHAQAAASGGVPLLPAAQSLTAAEEQILSGQRSGSGGAAAGSGRAGDCPGAEHPAATPADASAAAAGLAAAAAAAAVAAATAAAGLGRDAGGGAGGGAEAAGRLRELELPDIELQSTLESDSGAAVAGVSAQAYRAVYSIASALGLPPARRVAACAAAKALTRDAVGCRTFVECDYWVLRAACQRGDREEVCAWMELQERQLEGLQCGSCFDRQLRWH